MVAGGKGVAQAECWRLDISGIGGRLPGSRHGLSGWARSHKTVAGSCLYLLFACPFDVPCNA